MGVPFSHEVQKASHHIDTITPILKSTLFAIKSACIIHMILFCIFLVAVIALLISVNPDLAQERKALVTPLLRLLVRLLVGRSEGVPEPHGDEKLDRKGRGMGQGGGSMPERSKGVMREDGYGGREGGGSRRMYEYEEGEGEGIR
jgi:hypothetical protein